MSKKGFIFGRPLPLRPRFFFWSLYSFFNFKMLFQLVDTAIVTSRCHLLLYLFKDRAPSNLFCISVEDYRASKQVVSSTDHCCSCFPSILLAVVSGLFKSGGVMCFCFGTRRHRFLFLEHKVGSELEPVFGTKSEVQRLNVENV